MWLIATLATIKKLSRLKKMQKKEISKVMSFLGKKSAAKRDRAYYVNLGKKNKGKAKPRRKIAVK